MSTLRINNIEAQAVPASASIDEKIKLTNSSGDVLVHIDGKTSGITTIGINTTASNITFDANSNVVVTGIITATRFSGQITPTSLEIGSNIKLGNAGVITATSFSGAVSGTTGTFSGALSIAEKIIHTGDTNTSMKFDTDTVIFETAGDTRLRITSTGQVNIGGDYAQTDSRVTIIDATKLIQEATLNLQSSATSGAADTGAVLRFYGHSGTEGRYHSSIKGAKENGTSGNYAGYLSFNTRPNGSAMVERLRIASDGKVYFGDFASVGSKAYILKEVNGDYKFNIFASSSTTTNRIITFNSRSNVEAMRITADGKLGLGTNNPDTFIHAKATGNANVTLTLEQGTTAGNVSGIKVGRTDGAGNARMTTAIVGGIPVSGVPGIMFGSTDTNLPAIGFQTPNSSNGHIVFSPKGSEKLRIKSNGFVGVGTANPLRKFHVADDNSEIMLVQSGNASGSYINYKLGANGAALGMLGSGAAILSGGADAADFGIRSSGDLCFSSGGHLERARFDISGRLLIGTTASFNGGILCIGSGQGTNHPSGEGFKLAPSANTITFLDSSSNGSDTGNIQLWNTIYNNSSAKIEFYHPAGNVGGIKFNTHDGSSLNNNFSIDHVGVLYNTCRSNGACNLTLKKVTASNGIDYFQCRNKDNTLQMVINYDGNVRNANNSYGQTSDLKLKENIVDANSQWDDIKAIKVRNFNFKESTGLSTHKQIGVVAQEIETVSAGLVSESIDRNPDTSADLGTTTKTVKYSILYMKSVKALQEAMTRIETLEAEVAALKSS